MKSKVVKEVIACDVSPVAMFLVYLILILKNIPVLTLILIFILILAHMKRRWEALRIAYRAGISVLLLCVPPPTERHKQEGAVLGRLGEHMRMP